MIILKASDVKKALPMVEVVSAMKKAYAALSDGKAKVPLRVRLHLDPYEGVCLFMPSFVQDDEGDALALKVVSVFPNNTNRDLPIIHAAILVLEAETGRPKALLEGGILTAIRTGAAAGAATDLLARSNCKTAAIFGAGVQGRTQLEAICTVRSIETVWVYDPNLNTAETFIAEMAGKGSIPNDLRIATNPRQAITQADVICTATTSTNPVFNDDDLKVGAHINGVGSYTPEMQEVPQETVTRALLVVDSREVALAEAGDIIQPIKRGIITTSHIHAELGEIVLGRKSGRTSDEQLTFFKSVGVAVQDAVAARLAIQNALEMGMGQRVTWEGQ